MSPKLILLNGNPGMGKTTLAQRYIDEHHMTMSLDIDNIWIMMGGWDTLGSPSIEQKVKYAYAVADLHLADGYDLIVPQLMESTEQYEVFEGIARKHGAALIEIALLSTADDAVERCKARARKAGHADGFRPGGVLDTTGREQRLLNMHAGMLAAIAQRPNMIRIESTYGSPNEAYERMLAAIET